MEPNPEQDADRAAFEDKFKHGHIQGIYFERNEDGSYKHILANAAFMGWQAAKADSRAMQEKSQAAAIGSDNTQTVYALLDERKQIQDAFEQVCKMLNYWLPPDEPNPHRTDKVSQFHQQKWLEACKSLEDATPFRKRVD